MSTFVALMVLQIPGHVYVSIHNQTVFNTDMMYSYKAVGFLMVKIRIKCTLFIVFAHIFGYLLIVLM